MYPTENWHNIRYTWSPANAAMQVATDYELSVRDAVDTFHHNQLPIMTLYKVEWKGRQVGSYWNDVTDYFKSLHHETVTRE